MAADVGGWREPSLSKDVTLANSQLTQRRAGAANEAIEEAKPACPEERGASLL
jgi:hypothetical protein